LEEEEEAAEEEEVVVLSNMQVFYFVIHLAEVAFLPQK
jgi:hypothetical protein